MLITPEWPAPRRVRAYCTTRLGINQQGVSQAPYDRFNLAYHVNDNPQHVTQNRALLVEHLALPHEPLWLNQIHSNTVINAQDYASGIAADACISQHAHQVCIIMTADCLPILLCDRHGQTIAAIHAGWRGLLNGVIQQTLQNMPCSKQEILAWLGPAISQPAFEVGTEVREQFVNQDITFTPAFTSNARGRWQADLYQLARTILTSNGVTHVYGEVNCTFHQPDLFYSYRRDGEHSGRMASLIYLHDD
ncbi:MAG: peptidoglycan editing factor PgeF [Gammaproteobacteria bacterium]